ncbi:DNA-directed RNA polymerase subunit omega, partial [Candidatus Endolissoclinum faulkneri]
MARVTVEDCIVKIFNRFDLVMIAAQRSRNISSGSNVTIDKYNDKNPVIALREIAEETVDVSWLRESLIRSLQKQADFDKTEDDNVEGLMGS